MADDLPGLEAPASRLGDILRRRAPLTVAAFMELALYHPDYGYYAREGQRSGRAGDFFTSVDVGPLFGTLLEIQFEEMWRILEAGRSGLEAAASRLEGRGSDGESGRTSSGPEPPGSSVHIVEAGAGNGRLAADVLRAARERDPAFYAAIRLHLVEASAAARAAQRQVLGEVADRLASSAPGLPESFEGVLYANELLDAMPVHQVVMRPEGLREVFAVCDAAPGGPETAALRAVEGEPSTPRLGEYLERAGVRLAVGARAEIGLAAVDWVRAAARRLRRGFIVLFDYGHEATELYSTSHAGGTLTTFSRHTMAGSESATPAWIAAPGEQDITAHVDFTSVRAAAEAEGCLTLGLLDQTYFLMGLVQSAGARLAVENPRTGRALKTLVMPGGLGSTVKVLVLAKNVGTPKLRGCSYRLRLT